MQRPWRFWLRIAFYLLAAGLMALAIKIAVSQVDWQSLKQIAPAQWLMLIAAVMINLTLAGVMFWSVTLSFDASPRVRFGRMMTLVAASALLNYLPLRPGLLGRAAYLKTHHQLPIRQSFVILLVVLVMGTLVTLTVGLLAWLMENPWLLTAGLALAGMLGMALAKPVAIKCLRRPVHQAWLWVLIRLIDTLVAGFRLWLAFAILGQTMDYRQALLAGAAGLLVAMIGLTPNGLGLKEWVIALMIHTLAVASWEQALAASLLDRAIEAIVIIPVGLLAMLLLGLDQSNPSDPSDAAICPTQSDT